MSVTFNHPHIFDILEVSSRNHIRIVHDAFRSNVVLVRSAVQKLSQIYMLYMKEELPFDKKHVIVNVKDLRDV